MSGAIHISSSPGGTRLPLVDEDDGGIEEGLLSASAGNEEQEQRAIEKSVPRVDKLWQEHHGVLRGGGKKKNPDRNAAVMLLVCALVGLGVLLYSLGKGDIFVMERIPGRGGWVGLGLLQVSHRKSWVFALVPLQSFIIGWVWVLLLRVRAKAAIFLTILAAPVLGVVASITVMTHASANSDGVLLGGGVVCLLWSLWFAIAACRADVLTPAVAQEASFRLWAGGERWSSLGVGLVAGTMCVLALFLWAALVACGAHLWSMPDESGERLREGPRWMLLPLVVVAIWCGAWLDSLLRFTVSSVVSAKYFSSAPGMADGSSENALASLYTAVWSNTPSLSRGSAVVGPARLLRRIQVWVEGFGEKGKGWVSMLCGLLPVLMPCVYLGPHGYVLLAQGRKGGFMVLSREAFKLLARNGLMKAAYAIIQSRVFAGIRAIGAFSTILLITRTLHEKDQKIHTIMLSVAVVVGDAILSRLTSLVHFSMDSIVVCYAQELESCRPHEPNMCSTSLHAALEACTEHELQENEHRYSTDRQAVHTADQL